MPIVKLTQNHLNTDQREVTEIDNIKTKTNTNTDTQIEFEDLVLEHIRDRLGELSQGQSYVAEKLFAPGLWEQFNHGDRRRAGRVISQLVKANALPLICGKKVNGNTKTYQLL